MKSYLLVDINIKDLDGFKSYVGSITPLISKHNGRYLVQGVEPEVILDDEHAPSRVAVIEFATDNDARAFVAERAELGLSELFASSTQSRILLVQGVKAKE